MKQSLFLLLCLAAATLAAAPPIVLEERDGELAITAPGYQAVLADPGKVLPESCGGARFSRGGWLQSLKDQKGRELLRCKDVFSWHPARGMALEFTVTPSLYRDSAEYELWLKPGVGIIRRTNVDQVEQLFSWQTSVERRSDAVIVQMTQSTPPGFARSYELSLRYEFFDQYFTINGDLGNPGKAELVTDVLLHPFFEPPADHGNGRIRLPANDPKLEPMNFALLQLPFRLEFRYPGLISAEIVNLKNGGSVKIGCTPAADAVIFWRSAMLESFSLEPLYQIRLRPGQKFNWQYRITPAGN